MARRRRPPRPGALTELPPLKILTQILALQGLYYLSALVMMLFTALVAGMRFRPDLVFGWRAVRGDTTQGWLMAFVWLLDGGLFMSVAIVMLVMRSKLVLDFALTLHAIHLLVVTLYTRRLPRNAMWWATMAASSAVSVTLGIWGCRYRELKPISFGGGGGGTVNGGNGEGSNRGGPSSGEELGIDGDEELGFSRGRGRGRWRDGGGEYEMVTMKGETG
ncbi:hypothetical protein VTK73DRAFT_9658 [Phialemonium thermophilum]|uniref:Integral membrane protein n=1 Tax=Phialemonium thermophilum TaxID=223376 RepID=A0ABR3XK95_9PEZI